MNQRWMVLEQFFTSVFGWKQESSKFQLPERNDGLVWMVRPASLDGEFLCRRVAEQFNVIPGSWLPLEARNLKLSFPQVRPAGTYLFAYRDGQVPDAEHLGLSQEDAFRAKMSFMKMDEYLLATAFRKFTCGEFLDMHSETVLAESRNYGGVTSGMVYGFHQHRGRNPEGHDPEGYDGICLFNGPPHVKIATAGPREVFL